MSELTTAAGRALHMRLDGPNVDLDFHRYGEAIAVIEAEAAAAARAALLDGLEAAVKGLPEVDLDDAGWSRRRRVAVSAVLAEISRRRP